MHVDLIVCHLCLSEPKNIRKLTLLAGKSTMNEDVFDHFELVKREGLNGVPMQGHLAQMKTARGGFYLA